MANDLNCECGKTGLNTRTIEIHKRSKAHQGWEAMQTGDPDSLPPDLQTPVDLIDEDPRLRAQMVRAAFGARGWPNKQHPGTVREFCVEHDIPIVDVPRHLTAGEATKYVTDRIKEITRV